MPPAMRARWPVYHRYVFLAGRRARRDSCAISNVRLWPPNSGNRACLQAVFASCIISVRRASPRTRDLILSSVCSFSERPHGSVRSRDSAPHIVKADDLPASRVLVRAISSSDSSICPRSKSPSCLRDRKIALHDLPPRLPGASPCQLLSYRQCARLDHYKRSLSLAGPRRLRSPTTPSMARRNTAGSSHPILAARMGQWAAQAAHVVRRF